MLRLFIAVPPCSEAVQTAAHLLELNQGVEEVRWVPPENLHLTCYFLGETEEKHLPRIIEIMGDILTTLVPFTLTSTAITLEGGKPGRPSMVWARFHRNLAFTGLSNLFRDRLASFAKSPSKFHDPVPHITMARIKHGQGPMVEIDFNCSIRVSGFELWKTIPVHGGVKYEVIEKFYPVTK